MEKRAFTLVLILLSTTLAIWTHSQQSEARARTWTVDGDNASADFTRIQSAIDAAAEGDTIYVSAGVYHEHLVVNKSISLLGENRSTTVIDGQGGGTVVLAIADYVDISDFTVRSGDSGVYVLDAANCTVSGNFVHDNRYGIRISRSRNCTAHGNYVFSNSGYGINVNASRNALVNENGASGNYFDGIGLFASNDTVVRENTVSDTTLFGIVIDANSINNVIYRNNIFNNGIQVASSNPANSWDHNDEGNYWGDYEGDDADGDAIGDEAYIVNEDINQKDSYPLLRPYVNEAYRTVDTEPPVASFTFFPEGPFANETISFNALSSHDAVGRNAIADYEWSFGDGTTTTGSIANHTYLVPGNYTAVLTVVDMARNEGSASSQVQVLVKSDESETPHLPIIGAAIILVLVFGVIVYVLRRKND
jgi:parallel beta-helix repeat protein